MKPLENLLVVDMSQYLAGPSAGLRLADLGARVIKIERPRTGEAGRQLSIKNLFADDNSLLFHTINRNKESFAADLKNQKDFKQVKDLIARADVLIHSFRPGKIEKIGLGYNTVKKSNQRLIYGVVSGYGNKGPWFEKPGQDLLIQSVSGLAYLSGDKGDPPVPFGVSAIDILCGTYLVQGILAALVRRGKSDNGALVEISLLETALDLQFEVLTTYLNDGGKDPVRAKKGNAHAYLSAPYGVYKTRDGYIALAMENLQHLGEIMGCQSITTYEKSEWFSKRDEIMDQLREEFVRLTTKEWLELFEPSDIWCAEINDYQTFINSQAYKSLQMDQYLELGKGKKIKTTRCPIRIDGEPLFNSTAAPAVGEHTDLIKNELYS